MNKLGAVILAAGLSSRMQDFKPLLRINGETMISRVVAMMKRAGAEPVVVVTGFRREELEESLNGRNVVLVHNERYMETQMLESLIIGLDAISEKCEKILVSPSDVPLVRPETVDDIIKTDGKFVRPVYRGRPGHPVLLGAEIVPIVRSYKGEGGLRGAVEASGIEIIEMATDDFGVTFDADTKEDYAKMIEFSQSCVTRKGESQ